MKPDYEIDIDDKRQGEEKYDASSDTATVDTASDDTATANTAVNNSAADKPPPNPLRGG